MLIDPPIEEIKKYLGNYREFESRVNAAVELVE